MSGGLLQCCVSINEVRFQPQVLLNFIPDVPRKLELITTGLVVTMAEYLKQLNSSLLSTFQTEPLTSLHLNCPSLKLIALWCCGSTVNFYMFYKGLLRPFP